MRQFTILLALLLACTAGTVRADEPVRVACVGNSITQGVGTRNQYQDSYPGVLRQLLGQGYDVRNFGYSGRTALRRGDYPYLRERMLVDAVNYRPDILIVKLGTNDSKPWNWKFHADFERDLTEIVESFRRPEGLPRVYLCLPVPSFLAPGSIDSAVIAHEVVPAVRRVARRLGAHVIDLHTPMKAYARCFPDGIHPNAEGAARMAALVYEALTGREAPDYTPGQPFPGRRSEWEGYARYDFIHAGREATVVAPRKAAPGRPWIWRPAFFGAFPSVDKALLERGFHVAYYDLTHLYGSPRAVRLADDFYGTMRRYYGLSPHVTLEGFSRGALLVWNWAACNPDKVACIYVDAPVCDVLSWPGRRQKDLWADLLAEWGIEDSKADTQFARMALKALPRLAKAGIPIIAVCGDADKVVPASENIQPVADAYAKLGGVAELIVKPGCDHHPHSLDDPTPVVDFILRYQDGYTARQHLTQRTGTARAFQRFRTTGKGCVAFLGGSITAMRGWKEEVEADLRQRFPHTEFTFIEAGLPSAGSTPHAFRFEADVLAHGTPDLLFLEAAVNDDTNGFSPVAQVRGMEGIVRHALTVNPDMDIVMLHFIYDPFITEFAAGRQPDVILNHERVANRYGLASINCAQEAAERMAAGEFTWAQFGGTHPAPFGHKYYAADVARLFDITLRQPDIPQRPDTLPAPLDSLSYSGGKLVDVRQADRLKGFRYVEDWAPTPPHVETRAGFVHVPMLEATKAGSRLRLKFTGRAIGLFAVAGPDAGAFTYRIDGGPERRIDTYTQWSAGVYLPWTFMLADDLTPGEHTLTLEVAEGERTTLRLRDFVVNR